MLVFSAAAHASSQGCNWFQEETAELVVLWGEAKVFSQFAQSGHSNVHIYKVDLGLWGCVQMMCCIVTKHIIHHRSTHSDIFHILYKNSSA